MPDYGYLNARLRGMKTRLLAEAEYEKMLRTANIPELVEAAAGTGLKKAMEAALIRYGGLEALEVASRTDFAAACRKVLAISEGEQRALVRVLLRRWDVFNVKTILRGKHASVSPVEMLRNVVPAADLDIASLQEMAAQPGVREVVGLLATWGSPLADPLVENLPGYESDHHLVRLELALDRWRFERALRECRGPGNNARLVRECIRGEIDIANIMAKVRLILEDVDTFVETAQERQAREKREREEARRRAWRHPEAARPPVVSPRRRVGLKPRERPPLPPIQSFFIPGGEVTGKDRLVSLLRMRTMGEFLSFLAASRLGAYVSADMRELGSIPDLAEFEHTLEADLFQRMAGLYRRQPIGIAMAVSYLWRRYAEFINLRIITRGKEFGIPENVLRGEMSRAH